IAQTERSAPGRGGRRGRAEGQIENRREQDREQRGERGGEIARREEERDGGPVRRHIRAEQPQEAPEVLGASGHEPAASPVTLAGARRSVSSFCAGSPRAVSSATCASGRSNVATTIPSTSSLASSASDRTAKPRKLPPGSRAKTPTGSRPNSLSAR